MTLQNTRQAKLVEADEPTIGGHYIESQKSLVDRPMRTLKHGDAFAVLDGYGDIGSQPDTPEGLFFRDTRYLSRFEVLFEGLRPLFLSSVLQNDNAALSVDLSNPDIRIGEVDVITRDLIAISRTKFLWADTCYDRIALRNYDSKERRFRIEVRFDCDFRDLFEVRGALRAKQGSARTELTREGVETTYVGLDGAERRTTILFDPKPQRVTANVASYFVTMPAGGRKTVLVAVACQEGPRKTIPPFLVAFRDKRRAMRALTRDIATVVTSNEVFNEVICRSTSDLYMLTTQTSQGFYPYAGIPWYSTIFGRDGIITAIMMLWVDPTLAGGVLRYLAANQATSVDKASDAEPGKILHERRHGEMAHTGEVPFRRYYGTVDATPLFVLLAGLYFERTGDTETLRELWPNIKAALSWCDTYGDRDGDGFVEYFRQTDNGLANQGWKDSHDSIFHADGSTAEGPIALVEVQGYVYAAKIKAARIAVTLGDEAHGERLLSEAEELRRRFEDVFWCEEIGTYALALDGRKNPCRVRTSNAGHALFAGIASPDRARRVAATLMNSEGFSGWGVRTLATSEARYNPMSYHNGSVWPHDNAIIALGFGMYNLKSEAATVFDAMFAAVQYQEHRRLPELFCGFTRKPRRGPTSYPVACSPQAWAAAAPFALLAACLGMEMAYDRNVIRYSNSCLPPFIDDVIMRGLRLGDARLDVRLHRYEADVSLNVLNRHGDTQVIMTK